jgi:hypothetical protein
MRRSSKIEFISQEPAERRRRLAANIDEINFFGSRQRRRSNFERPPFEANESVPGLAARARRLELATDDGAG